MPRRDLAVALVKEIASITANLVQAGMVDDQNAVTRTLHNGRAWTVAQPGADMSVALKKQPYAEVYEEMAVSGNYALHLLDGALVQFAYSGVRNVLIRHRLAYLPAPDLEPYQNDPDLYFGEHHFVDIVGHQVMPVPVRFDFDSREGVAQDMVHPVSHITLGQYQHCRVPATRAVGPGEFMSFILRSFYSTPDRPQPEFAASTRLGSTTITRNEASRTHVMLP